MLNRARSRSSSMLRETGTYAPASTMADPELPGIPPKPEPPWQRRLWEQLSSRRKRPAWFGIALWIITEIPDWRHRLDFWFGTVEAMGGYLGDAAVVLGSTYFRWGILIIALGYLVFVGEPKRGVQRHPWWPIVGWSVLGACLTAITITLGAGYFEMRVRHGISERPLIINQRSLTLSEKDCLRREILESGALNGRKISVGAVNADREGMYYAKQFLDLFGDLGIADDGINHKSKQGSRFAHSLTSNDPTMHGVLVAVIDKEHPTADQQAFRSTLSQCGIASQFVEMDFAPTQTWLVIDQAP